MKDFKIADWDFVRTVVGTAICLAGSASEYAAGIRLSVDRWLTWKIK
ncbi:hypothetical protein LQE92_13750 [Lacrimispora sp. NSJ-141]|uniref:Uncharacterized protein n=1 Tax=Lientehia hominis TaxID=2897778 RepID=A0AAP2RKU3_9FIRM|nr:hypothetical protein [Lientehia hominis]MCD2493670.1 hypothetical protein [Lientehia hominis]